MTTIGSAQDDYPSQKSLKEAQALLKEAETLLGEPRYIHTVYEEDAEYIVLHALPEWGARRSAFLAKLKSKTTPAAG